MESISSLNLCRSLLKCSANALCKEESNLTKTEKELQPSELVCIFGISARKPKRLRDLLGFLKRYREISLTMSDVYSQHEK